MPDERTPSLHFNSPTVAGLRLLLRTNAVYNDPPQVGLWWNDILMMLPTLKRKFPDLETDDDDPLLPALVAVETVCFGERNHQDRRNTVLEMSCDEFIERLRRIVADDPEQGSSETRSEPDVQEPATAMSHNPYNGLILFLHGMDKICIADLPDEFQNPDLLQVCDADGLIEFGRRRHCFVGGELRLEHGWEFCSLTGPNRKPLRKTLAEAEHDPDEIAFYVRLTPAGEVNASRLRLTLDSARTSKVAALPEDRDVAALLNLIARYYPDKPMARIVREFYSTNGVSRSEKQIQAMLRKLRRYRNGR